MGKEGWGRISLCISMVIDWTRLLWSRIILVIRCFNVGVFSLGCLGPSRCRIYKRNKTFYVSFTRILAVFSWMKRKRGFHVTYFSHHLTITGYFPSYTLHLVRSCWERLPIVVYSKRSMFIFHKPQPPVRREVSSLIRQHTTRWSVNAATTVSSPPSDH